MRSKRRWWAAGVAICLAAVAAACGARAPDVGFIADTKPPNRAVLCSRTAPPAQAWKDVGPNRDVLHLVTPLSSGSSLRHVLTVPDNAVPAGTDSVRFQLRDTRYRFIAVAATSIPEMAFNPRVMLTLSYAGCEPNDTTGLRMYRLVWDDPRWKWEPVPGSVHSPVNKTVTAPRDSLSEYALGAG